MNRITEVVKNLIIINIIVFAAKSLLPAVRVFTNKYFVLYGFDDVSRFNPIQIVTYMFNHADLNHIFFNMLGLFFIGPFLEHTIGQKRFLFLYLAAGLGGAFLNQILGGSSIGMLGASACVLGVVVAFAMKYPNMEMMLMFIPIPIKAKYLVSAFVLIDVFFGFGGVQDGIAHFAHLGGAIVGFVLVLIWNKYPNFLA